MVDTYRLRIGAVSMASQSLESDRSRISFSISTRITVTVVASRSHRAIVNDRLIAKDRISKRAR